MPARFTGVFATPPARSRQFHTSERDGGRSEGLEPQHRSAAALDRAMVLLNDVVKVRAITHDHEPPAQILLAQQPQCPDGSRYCRPG
jgi:hypothetical protein